MKEIPADRLKEIQAIKRESISRADMQMGDNPNIYPYMNSYATFLLAAATSLVAVELNQLNSFLLSRESSDPFD